MLRSYLLAGAALPCLSLAVPALAQTSSSTDTPAPSAAWQPVDVGSDIVVTGYRYLDADTSGITNLPLPVENGVNRSVTCV
ncbi:hypothetical protein J2Y58_003978 [Sphingomonas sp. BE138]|nr:hypothetical protein [Sphingomonas sp. BE138]